MRRGGGAFVHGTSGFCHVFIVVNGNDTDRKEPRSGLTLKIRYVREQRSGSFRDTLIAQHVEELPVSQN